MADVLLCVVLLTLALFMVAAGFSMLVLTEIIKAEDVRRWFNRKRRSNRSVEQGINDG